MSEWRKPSKCGTHGSCVEVAEVPPASVSQPQCCGGHPYVESKRVLVLRDGKLGDDSHVLRLDLHNFFAAVKAGEYDDLI